MGRLWRRIYYEQYVLLVGKTHGKVVCIAYCD